MKRVSALVAVVLAFVLLYFIAYSISDLPFFLKFHFGRPGAIDIAAYWSAWKVLASGNDPYNVENIFRLQRELNGPAPDYLLVFWNPPWTLTLLSPLLLFDFSNAALSMFVLNSVLAVLSGALLGEVLGVTPKTRLWCIAAALLFAPNLSVLYFGQLGLITTFALCLFLWCEKRGYSALAGLSLVAATIKPHAVYLFWIVFLIWVVRKRRWRELFGLGCGVLLLLAPAMAFYPGVLTSWLQGYQGSFSMARVPTLGSFLRELAPQSRIVSSFALVGLPCLTAIATVCFFFRKIPNINWTEILPVLLPLSLITSAYSRFHDQSVLLIIEVLLIAFLLSEPSKKQRNAVIVFLLFLAQLVTVILMSSYFKSAHQFLWFPVMMLSFWLVRARNNWSCAPNEAPKNYVLT